MELVRYEIENLAVADATGFGEPAATVVTVRAEFGARNELGRTVLVKLQLPRDDNTTLANIHKLAHAELVKFLPEAARQIESRVAGDATKLRDEPPQG